MKTLVIAIALLTMAFSVATTADEVNQANITVFQPGSPALASDMNSTIQALVSAINDNAVRVAALETPVALDDLIGRSYCSAELINVLTHEQNPQGDAARVSVAVIKSVLTITSPTQLTFMSNDDSQVEMLLRDKQYDFGPGDPVAPDYRQVTDSEVSLFAFGPETEVLTITGYTGGVLTTDDGLSFQISPDGNVMTNAGLESRNDGSFNGYESFFLVAVRCD